MSRITTGPAVRGGLRDSLSGARVGKAGAFPGLRTLFARRRDASAPLSIHTAQLPILHRSLPATDPAPVPVVARDGVPPLEMDLPLDWDQYPHGDRNWRAQLNMVRMADGHLLGFEHTGDPRFMRWPVALHLDWYDFHVARGRSSRYGWGDMIVGQRAARLAYVLAAARARPGIASLFQRRRLAVSAVAHATRIIDINPVRLSNHVFDDLVGVGALEQVLPPDPWRARIAAFVDFHLPRLFAMQFGEGGVHRENSPAYQSFAIGKLELLAATGWFDGHGIAALLADARKAYRWFRTPENRAAPVGDSNGYPERKVQTTAPKETGLFRAAGYLVRRDDTGANDPAPSSYFLFMGSAQAPFHKHNDDLSWHWHDRVPIVTDTGKYAYLTNEARDYAVSARAHSTIEIDRRDPLPSMLGDLMAHPMGGDLLRHVEETPLGTLVSARAVHPRLGAAHVRTLLYRPGRFVLIADIVEDLPADEGEAGEGQPPEARPVTQWTHFAPAIHLAPRGPMRFAARLGDGRGLDVRLATADEGATAELIRGALEPRRQGWASEAYAELTPRDAVGLTVPGHLGLSRLGSLITLGTPPRRLGWTRQNRLRAEFADETIVLTPDAGGAGDRPLVRLRPPPAPTG